MHSAVAVCLIKKMRLRIFFTEYCPLFPAPFSVAISLGIGLLAWHYGIRHQFSMFLFHRHHCVAWRSGSCDGGGCISTVVYDYFATSRFTP